MLAPPQNLPQTEQVNQPQLPAQPLPNPKNNRQNTLVYTTEQNNFTVLNAIHCGNVQLHFGRTLQSPTIEEVVDEPIPQNLEKDTTLPVNIIESTSVVGVANLPREEGGEYLTEFSKDILSKEKIQAPFLKCLKSTILKETPKMTLAFETALI